MSDFAIDSENIVRVLAGMMRRGVENPVRVGILKYDDIAVLEDERKAIGIYVCDHRSILSKSGIVEYPGMFGDGPTKTISTAGKLLYLSHDSTSVSYCQTVIAEIEEAVSAYIHSSMDGVQ